MLITIPDNATKTVEPIDSGKETLEVTTYTWFKGERAYSYAYYAPRPLITLQ